MTDATPRCPECGHELPNKQARFCRECGASTVKGGAHRKADTKDRVPESTNHSSPLGPKSATLELLELDPDEELLDLGSASEPTQTATIDEWEIEPLGSEPPASAAAPSQHAVEVASVPGAPVPPATPAVTAQRAARAAASAPAPSRTRAGITPSARERPASPPFPAQPPRTDPGLGQAAADPTPFTVGPAAAKPAPVATEALLQAPRQVPEIPETSTPARGKDDEMANFNAPVQEKRTVVEEGTTLKGNLESACPVVVHGRVEGDVRAPSLTVSATGAIEGTAHVGTIRSEGELAGEFDAEHVELSGNIKDNTVIRAATIEIKLTGKRGKKQIIFGDSEITEEEQPVPTAQKVAGKSQPPASKPPEVPALLAASRPENSMDRPSAAPMNGRASQPPPAE